MDSPEDLAKRAEGLFYCGCRKCLDSRDGSVWRDRATWYRHSVTREQEYSLDPSRRPTIGARAVTPRIGQTPPAPPPLPPPPPPPSPPPPQPSPPPPQPSPPPPQPSPPPPQPSPPPPQPSPPPPQPSPPPPQPSPPPPPPRNESPRDILARLLVERRRAPRQDLPLPTSSSL
ncbi:hypothetical protein PENSPDRAFT_754155 [Peniophora sp. CONT]|nr:hypothetical protein PENSPDRAFT_760299 [Peniophora sp. CONT]KZV68316.1 hypothetical protein PENSPDRAFT_754155 [Peniophora sp. CONT]